MTSLACVMEGCPLELRWGSPTGFRQLLLTVNAKLCPKSNGARPGSSPEQAAKLGFRYAVGSIGFLLQPFPIDDRDHATIGVNEAILFQQVERNRDTRPPHTQHDGEELMRQRQFPSRRSCAINSQRASRSSTLLRPLAIAVCPVWTTNACPYRSMQRCRVALCSIPWRSFAAAMPCPLPAACMKVSCGERSVPMMTANPVIPSLPIRPTSMPRCPEPLATTEAKPRSMK